jgi:ribosomal protein L18
MNQNSDNAELGTAPGAAYEIIRKRLDQHSRILGEKLAVLNTRRLEIFGSTALSVIGRARIRTENNCVPRDIVDIGGNHLLFAYEVFVGMRAEIEVSDVFSLHKIEEKDREFELPAVPQADTFLADPRFVADFKELYRYYKDARLSQLRNLPGKKLAVFQVGRTLADAKVFRWECDVNGVPRYLDNRGERDNVYPPAQDFTWQATTREDHINGVYPHVSILNEVFVETVKGDLTIKIENNTENGEGIYNESVEDPNQALADAQIQYARLGLLILLKIRPYREKEWRYFVFNTRLKSVTRIDAIGRACVALPEDHGIVFPGGYYLQSGDTKIFENEGLEQMTYMRHLRAANGEDVLYVFHDETQGRMVLFSYNLIRREVQNPIICHGYSIFPDGRMLIFRDDSNEPTRTHPLQIWQTPYLSDEYATAPSDGSYLAHVGNADLVRGISDAYSIQRLLDEAQPRRVTYESVIAAARRMLDTYHWLDAQESGQLANLFRDIHSTAELIIDEFEKVEALRQRAAQLLNKAEQSQHSLLADTRPRHSVQEFTEALAALRQQRGALIGLRDIRYMDEARVDTLEQAVIARFDALSQASVAFLLDAKALAPYHTQLDEVLARVPTLRQSKEIALENKALTEIDAALDLLQDVFAELEIEDVTARTRILEDIAEVRGKLNRVRAELQLHGKSLRTTESVAEFGAQFKLFTQSVAGALNLVDSPDKADDALARLMLQLEDMEGRFSEFDDFIAQIAEKREEVYAAFETRKQQLQEERQRHSLNLIQAANRVLQSVARRAAQLQDTDAQNAFFAADSMVQKVRDFIAKLHTLGDSVKAGDLEARLKSLRDQAGRELRDRQEIFAEGGALIKLGKHQFSVNTQELELSLVPYRQDEGIALAVHLSGTDFFEVIQDAELEKQRSYWEQNLVSETAQVSRAEYLAAVLFFEAEQDPALQDELKQAALSGKLLESVRRFATARYHEAYERGIHDHDATLILEKLLNLNNSAGLLRYPPAARTLAQLFWAFYSDRKQCERWHSTARSLGRLYEIFPGSSQDSGVHLQDELWRALELFSAEHALLDENTFNPALLPTAAAYLRAELQAEFLSFSTNAQAMRLSENFLNFLDSHHRRSRFTQDLQNLQGQLVAQIKLTHAWLSAYASTLNDPATQNHLIESTAILVLDQEL